MGRAETGAAGWGDRHSEGFEQERKKGLYWHTTFGRIQITEQVYRCGGKQLRPFSGAAGVKCRGYSRRLQRVITDFGADVSFGRVPQKLKEHYGIDRKSTRLNSSHGSISYAV